MDNTKEKVLELSADDEIKVSGGQVHTIREDHLDPQSNDIDRLECITCDVCQGRANSKRKVVPFQGGHICIECIGKVEKELGRKIM